MNNFENKLTIVEANSGTRSLLSEFFSNKGYVVQGFDSTSQAFEKLSSSESAGQVLLVGTNSQDSMPALEFTSRIRALLPEIPLIFLTTSESAHEAVEAVRAGAFHAISHSVPLDDLKYLVDHAVAQGMPMAGLGVLFQDSPTLEELEKRYMKIVLDKTHGRKEKASRILGINRRTLYRKEREYGWVAGNGEDDLHSNSDVKHA